MHGPLLLWLYLATLFCANVVAFFLWSHLDRAGKVIGFILSGTFLVEIFRAYIRSESPLMNSVVLTLVLVGEVLGFGFLYLLTIHSAALGRKMLMLSFVLLLLVAGNIAFLQPLPLAQTNLYLFESVLLAAAAVHALYCLSVTSLTQKLLQAPAFWFWAMILIYQCSTLGFWGSQQLLERQSKSVQGMVANIQVIMNMLQYGGMIYGLSLYQPKKHRL